MKSMRHGFTMIELVFIIVIIGLLATVAISRLMGNKSDAQASICTHEVSQLVRELSTFYGVKGTLNSEIQEISNINNSLATNNSTPEDSSHGILEDSNLNPSIKTITYVCNGENITSIKYDTNQTIGNGTNYTVLTVKNIPATTEAGRLANNKLHSQGFFKQYILSGN